MEEKTEKETAEVYEHAYALFIALCSELYTRGKEVWKSKIDDEYFAMGFKTEEGGNVRYLIPMAYWEITPLAEIVKDLPEEVYTSKQIITQLLLLSV